MTRFALAAAPLVLASVSIHAQTAPQPDMHAFFYHAGLGTSAFVQASQGGGYLPLADRRLNTRLPAGSTVCVTIVNGHPLNYAYSLSVSIDSSSASFPDLSKHAALLQTLFPQPDRPVTDADARRDSDALRSPVWAAVSKLIEFIRPLDRQMGIARSLAKASDVPEQPAFVGRPAEAKAGFLYAVEAMSKLPDSTGHFHDPKLKESQAAAIDEAKKAVAADTTGKLAVAALAGYADALRSERDQIWNAFSQAEPLPYACGKTGSGRSTINLAIAKKDTAVGKRWVSKEGFRIVNDAPYERPLVSVAGVGFGVTGPSAREFHVNNGVLRSASPRMHFRPGLVIALNRYGGGPFNVFGTSHGIGLATDGKELLTDAFYTLLFSVGDFIGSRSDAIRVGLGAGASRLADRVEGFEINDPLPATAGNLDDLVKREWKPALYFVFTLPALNFGTAK